MEYDMGYLHDCDSNHALPNQNRQRGATLAEIVLYLAVAAIILLAVFSLFSNAFSGSKSQAEMTQLQGVVSAVNSIWGSQRDYGNDNLVPGLISAKAAPTAMVVVGNNTSLRNAWGGEVSIRGNGEMFSVAEVKVPRRACAEMAQVNIGAYQFSINNVAMSSPASATNAVTNCNTDENVLRWDIR